MPTEYIIDAPRASDMARLLAVWEASVRATHDFVSEEKIQALKNLIQERQLFQKSEIFCVRNQDNEVAGFVGVSNKSLDMLFLHPDAIGTGVGKALILYAINVKNATRVDVNEQNKYALSFYKHFGFEVTGRSETDDFGQPFPILHMHLKNDR